MSTAWTNWCWPTSVYHICIKLYRYLKSNGKLGGSVLRYPRKQWAVPKDSSINLDWQNAQKVLSYRAPSNGFSKYSGIGCDTERNRPQFAVQTWLSYTWAPYFGALVWLHVFSFRAFRDIHVPQLLFVLRNTKKISISCAGQFREHFVQSATSVYGMHLMTPEA